LLTDVCMWYHFHHKSISWLELCWGKHRVNWSWLWLCFFFHFKNILISFTLN
jgi:hypothetical protein